MKDIKKSKDLAKQFLKIIEKKINKNNFSIFDKWESIIGNKDLTTKCKIEDIKNNTLILKTYHTGWSQQIFFRKKQILKNINIFYPELNINNISIIIENKTSMEKVPTFKPKEKTEYFIEEKIFINNLDPKLNKVLTSLKKYIKKNKEK